MQTKTNNTKTDHAEKFVKEGKEVLDWKRRVQTTKQFILTKLRYEVDMMIIAIRMPIRGFL